METNPTSPLLLSIGNLEWQKGYDYLLAAYHQLILNNIDFHAVFIGDGSLRNELFFSIEDLNLQDHVIIKTNATATETEALKSAASLIIISDHVSSNTDLIKQSLKQGKVIVATNTEENSQLIQHNENGVLVPVRQPLAMAESLTELLTNKTARERIATAAKHVAVS